MSRTRCSVLYAAPQSRDPHFLACGAMGPGLAAHRYALRSIRGTRAALARIQPLALHADIHLALDIAPFLGGA